MELGPHSFVPICVGALVGDAIYPTTDPAAPMIAVSGQQVLAQHLPNANQLGRPRRVQTLRDVC
jgi:hypothetical protein